MYYYPQQQPAIYNNGGMYNIPPNPIGNIAPIGYGGYNNGYYTGQYSYYNPYYIQQQRAIQLAQQREAQRVESGIFKKLQTASASFLGYELTEEDLKRYDVVYDEDIVSDFGIGDQEEYYRLKQIDDYKRSMQQKIIQMQGDLVPCISSQAVAYCNAYNQMHEKAKKEIPDNVGLLEYLEKYAPKKYMEALEHDQRKVQADLTKTYNKVDYKELIDRSRGIYKSVFNPDANIDDQEIKLPNFISEKTMQERRKRFLAQLKICGGTM
jgi:hypothetical protein